MNPFASIPQPCDHPSSEVNLLNTSSHLISISRKPRLPPQPSASRPKPVDVQHTHNGQPPNQRPTPANPEVAEQRRAIMNASRGSTRPDGVVHGEQTGAVPRVRQRQTDEDDLEDEEDGGGDEQDDAERRHDPVDGRAAGRGPREHEERGGARARLRTAPVPVFEQTHLI